MTNCIVHAYREKIDKVYITASIYPDSRIVIKIKDNGCGGIADVKRRWSRCSPPLRKRSARAWALQ